MDGGRIFGLEKGDAPGDLNLELLAPVDRC
jgi:hypothetical protein